MLSCGKRVKELVNRIRFGLISPPSHINPTVRDKMLLHRNLGTPSRFLYLDNHASQEYFANRLYNFKKTCVLLSSQSIYCGIIWLMPHLHHGIAKLLEGGAGSGILSTPVICPVEVPGVG